MGLDRFVTFKDAAPSREELVQLCEDYFGGAALNIEFFEGRLVCLLPGVNSFAHRRVGPLVPRAHRAMAQEAWEDCRQRLGSKYYNCDRWIEIVLRQAEPGEPGSACVITRAHDEFTNALAEGLAKSISLGWGGEREPS